MNLLQTPSLQTPLQQAVDISSQAEKLTLMGMMVLIIVGLLWFIKKERNDKKEEIKDLKANHKEELKELKEYNNNERDVFRKILTEKDKRIDEVIDKAGKQATEFAIAIVQMQERETAREERSEESKAMYETKLDADMKELKRSLTDVARSMEYKKS